MTPASSQEPHSLQLAIWAHLDPETKWALSVAANRMLIEAVQTGIRLRYPHASDLEIADKTIRHIASFQS